MVFKEFASSLFTYSQLVYICNKCIFTLLDIYYACYLQSFPFFISLIFGLLCFCCSRKIDDRDEKAIEFFNDTSCTNFLKKGGIILDKENNALIIIDVQKAFDDKKWGERNNLNAEENISKILTLWRRKRVASNTYSTYVR